MVAAARRRRASPGRRRRLSALQSTTGGATARWRACRCALVWLCCMSGRLCCVFGQLCLQARPGRQPWRVLGRSLSARTPKCQTLVPRAGKRQPAEGVQSEPGGLPAALQEAQGRRHRLQGGARGRAASHRPPAAARARGARGGAGDRRDHGGDAGAALRVALCERALKVYSITALRCAADGCGLPLQAFRAYYKLRLERTNKKHLGKRAKRAAEAAAEEKDKAK